MTINKGSRWRNVEAKTSMTVWDALHLMHILLAPFFFFFNDNKCMRHSKYMNSVWNDSTLNLVLFELQELETQILDGLPSKIEQIISNLDDLSCSVGSFALHELVWPQHHLYGASYMYMLQLRAKLFSSWGTGIGHPNSGTIKQEVKQNGREPAGLNNRRSRKDLRLGGSSKDHQALPFVGKKGA